jgi:hypothetical protein
MDDHDDNQRQKTDEPHLSDTNKRQRAADENNESHIATTTSPAKVFVNGNLVLVIASFLGPSRDLFTTFQRLNKTCDSVKRRARGSFRALNCLHTKFTKPKAVRKLIRLAGSELETLVVDCRCPEDVKRALSVLSGTRPVALKRLTVIVRGAAGDRSLDDVEEWMVENLPEAGRTVLVCEYGRFREVPSQVEQTLEECPRSKRLLSACDGCGQLGCDSSCCTLFYCWDCAKTYCSACRTEHRCPSCNKSVCFRRPAGNSCGTAYFRPCADCKRLSCSDCLGQNLRCAQCRQTPGRGCV